MGFDSEVTPHEAALLLSRHLRREPWFLSVGIGSEAQRDASTFPVHEVRQSCSVEAAHGLEGIQGLPQVPRCATRRVLLDPQPGPLRAALPLAPPAVHLHRQVSLPSGLMLPCRSSLRLLGIPIPCGPLPSAPATLRSEPWTVVGAVRPFDPLELADHLRIAVSPRSDIRDARTLPEPGGRLRIEFNPNRPAAPSALFYRPRDSRTRCSRTAATTCATAGPHVQLPGDQWQLEAMCNVGAAELLMPFR